jgi:NAD(P)-dependent dehydrogenase (short-subunit alcohol dehydrogenase family)
MSRNVLITGGGSGLGKAMALRYAQEKANLCIVDKDIVGGETVVAQISNSGGSAFFIPCDITVQSDIDSLHATLHAKWQTIDVLAKILSNGSGIWILMCWVWYA